MQCVWSWAHAMGSCVKFREIEMSMWGTLGDALGVPRAYTSGHSECLETTGSPHGGACGQPKGCPTPLVRLWPL